MSHCPSSVARHGTLKAMQTRTMANTIHRVPSSLPVSIAPVMDKDEGSSTGQHSVSNSTISTLWQPSSGIRFEGSGRPQIALTSTSSVRPFSSQATGLMRRADDDDEDLGFGVTIAHGTRSARLVKEPKEEIARMKAAEKRLFENIAHITLEREKVKAQLVQLKVQHRTEIDTMQQLQKQHEMERSKSLRERVQNLESTNKSLETTVASLKAVEVSSKAQITILETDIQRNIQPKIDEAVTKARQAAKKYYDEEVSALKARLEKGQQAEIESRWTSRFTKTTMDLEKREAMLATESARLKRDQSEYEQAIVRERAALDQRELVVKESWTRMKIQSENYRKQVDALAKERIDTTWQNTATLVANAARGHTIRAQDRDSYMKLRAAVHDRSTDALIQARKSLQRLDSGYSKILKDLQHQGLVQGASATNAIRFPVRIANAIEEIGLQREARAMSLHLARMQLRFATFPIDRWATRERAWEGMIYPNKLHRHMLKVSNHSKVPAEHPALVSGLLTLAGLSYLVVRAMTCQDLLTAPSETQQLALASLDHKVRVYTSLQNSLKKEGRLASANRLWTKLQSEYMNVIELAAAKRAQRIVLKRLLGEWSQEDANSLTNQVRRQRDEHYQLYLRLTAPHLERTYAAYTKLKDNRTSRRQTSQQPGLSHRGKRVALPASLVSKNMSVIGRSRSKTTKTRIPYQQQSMAVVEKAESACKLVSDSMVSSRRSSSRRKQRKSEKDSETSGPAAEPTKSKFNYNPRVSTTRIESATTANRSSDEPKTDGAFGLKTVYNPRISTTRKESTTTAITPNDESKTDKVLNLKRTTFRSVPSASSPNIRGFGLKKYSTLATPSGTHIQAGYITTESGFTENSSEHQRVLISPIHDISDSNIIGTSNSLGRNSEDDSLWETCSEDNAAEMLASCPGVKLGDIASKESITNAEEHILSESSTSNLSDSQSDSHYNDTVVESDDENASDRSVIAGDVRLDYQIPDEVLKRAQEAVTGSPESFWSFRLYKNSEDKTVGMHYYTTFEKAEIAAAKLLQEPVLGFDLEWEEYSKPNLHDRKRCVSMLQLASESSCHLFHIALFKGNTIDELIPPSLRELLTSTKCFKTGVNIAGDSTRMRKCYDVEMQGIFELSHLYKVVMHGAKDPAKVNKRIVSLADQVQSLLLLPMHKGEVRTSRWSAKIDMEQSEYAASDAYAGFRIYHELDRQRKALNPTPPRPAFLELYLPLELANGTLVNSKARSRKDITSALDEDEEQDVFFDAPETQEEVVDVTEDATKETSNKTLEPRAKSTNSQSKEINLANAWIESWQSTCPSSQRNTLSAAPLRAYHIWHEQGYDIDETAAILRQPPLARNTVLTYIADAVMKGELAYDTEKLRTALEMLPSQAQGRYRALVSRLQARRQ